MYTCSLFIANMKQIIHTVLIAIFTLTNVLQMQAQGCETTIESIETASTDELSSEYRRLLSYKNPYCDTTGSDFELLMDALAAKLSANKATKDQVLQAMGEPYYQGALADYENQKVTIGRDGKPSGKSLPPTYKIPSGEYYIVYLWRNKDYVVFALKGGAVSEHKRWVKGDYR